jgi:hypothetical protein
MSIRKEAKKYSADEARAEHRACVDYHTALVNSRFTIAGLYVAAMGFIAAAVFKPDITWDFRAAISLLACWLSVCLWILELRSRALFTNVAHRGVEIERTHWGLTGENLMVGFFSRQHKLPACESLSTPPDQHWRKDPDLVTIAFRPRKPLSKRLSSLVSHSMGLDLLYSGGLAFWAISTTISTAHWVHLLLK